MTPAPLVRIIAALALSGAVLLGCRPESSFNAGRPVLPREGEPPVETPAPTPTGSHLTITSSRTTVRDGKLDVSFTTGGAVPMEGSTVPFAYLIRTSPLYDNTGPQPPSGSLVLTTHLPFDDSSSEDPKSGFHTHVWDFQVASAACAGYELEVVGAGTDAAFEYAVSGNSVTLTNVPVAQLASEKVTEIAALELKRTTTGNTFCARAVDSVKPGGYLHIKSATFDVDSAPGYLKGSITTFGPIPLDGRANGFGYAILTDGNNTNGLELDFTPPSDLSRVLVLVTHIPTFDDSSYEDYVTGFHFHVLDLKPPTPNCGGYDVEVDHVSSLDNAGLDPDYPYAIANDKITYDSIPRTHVNPGVPLGVVGFTVNPLFEHGRLTNLCVDVIPL